MGDIGGGALGGGGVSQVLHTSAVETLTTHSQRRESLGERKNYLYSTGFFEVDVPDAASPGEHNSNPIHVDDKLRSHPPHPPTTSPIRPPASSLNRQTSRFELFE